MRALCFARVVPADATRRLGMYAEAASEYSRATLATQAPNEQRYLWSRLTAPQGRRSVLNRPALSLVEETQSQE